MSDNFKSLDELFDNISRGGEVEFTYSGKSYSITHSDRGIHFMEANKYETEKIYNNPNEVADYFIDNKKFSEILKDITVTFRCF